MQARQEYVSWLEFASVCWYALVCTGVLARSPARCPTGPLLRASVKTVHYQRFDPALHRHLS
jgi:hypothetical protein